MLASGYLRTINIPVHLYCPEASSIQHLWAMVWAFSSTVELDRTLILQESHARSDSRQGFDVR